MKHLGVFERSGRYVEIQQITEEPPHRYQFSYRDVGRWSEWPVHNGSSCCDGNTAIFYTRKEMEDEYQAGRLVRIESPFQKFVRETLDGEHNPAATRD